MQLSSLLLFITGLGVAGGSVFLAQDVLTAQTLSQQSSTQQNGTVGVLVAGRDIAFGQAIDKKYIEVIQWPREALPDGILTEIDYLLPSEGVEPRRARKAMSQGELFFASRVSDWGEKVTITQSISANHRAMAIKVNAETAVGGFVTPGDAVDVLLTEGRNSGLRTVTILQDIKVIGVDQDSDIGKDSPEVARTVTVEVTPDQGQRLALAQQAGILSLTLRNNVGAEDQPLDSLKLSDLMRDVSPVAEMIASPRITVRRGVNISDEEL